jgi:DNA-binding SARP family transcriptional activator/tetratricopeptide (TPR) repeat protein
MQSKIVTGAVIVLHFGVLGSLLVAVDGQRMRVPAAKQRIAVACLLVRANQVVASDELIEIMWDGAPPSSAAATLRSNMARLRRVLGPVAGARIETGSPGYVICVADEELDLLRFGAAGRLTHDHARAGNWPACATAAAGGLSLWRGTPLCDVPAPVLQRDHVAPLIEQRLQMLEAGLAAQLHLGRDAEATAELTPLVAAHPLREHLVELLMLALYRCGRQAEALEAYAACRRLLVDELGVEPGNALQAMQRRILATDPALLDRAPDGATGVTLSRPGPAPGRSAGGAAEPGGHVLTSVVPQQLPGPACHFAGRSRELTALTELMEQSSAEGGTAAVCVISGVGGVGKTALAVQWAHQVADRFPDGQLYVNLQGFSPSGTAVSPQEALGMFLLALGVPPRRIPGELTAQMGLYRSLLAGKRVLVVLDNACDADQVRPLRPGGAACMTIVTSRSRLTGLLTGEGARPLVLEVLTSRDAHQLLAHRLGDQRLAGDPLAVDELIELCGALPLALSVAATRAQECAAAPLRALTAELRDAGTRLDTLTGGDTETDVRAVFSWSYAGLSPGAAHLFRLLGTQPGHEITAAAAGALTAMPPRQAAPILGELARASLLDEHVPGRFTCHDLLRAYAAERSAAQDSAAQRDLALGRLLQWYLRTADAAARVVTPARRHLSLGPAPPGYQAPKFAAYEQAMDWLVAERASLVTAVREARRRGLHQVAWQLPLALWDVFMLRGPWDQWIETGQIALRSARQLGDTGAEARVLNQLAGAYITCSRPSDAIECVRQAIPINQAAGDLRGEAANWTNLGRACNDLRRWPEAIAAFEQALPAARKAGHRYVERVVLNNLGEVHSALGDLQRALDYYDQSLQVDGIDDSRRLEAGTLINIGQVRLKLRQHQDAAKMGRQAVKLSRAAGDQAQEAAAHHLLGQTLAAGGLTEEARRHALAALAIYEDLGDPRAGQVRADLQAYGKSDQPDISQYAASQPVAR